MVGITENEETKCKAVVIRLICFFSVLPGSKAAGKPELSDAIKLQSDNSGKPGYQF